MTVQQSVPKKIWIVLGSLSSFLLFAGLHWGDRHGLLLAFFVVLTFHAYIFFYPKVHLETRYPFSSLKGRDPWGLLNELSEICHRAQIPTPRFSVLQTDRPLALAYGLTSEQNHILWSEALINKLNPNERKALLAHEVARFTTHNVTNATLASALTFPLASIHIFHPLLLLFMRAIVRQKTYIESDRLAASWLQNPEDLAQALMKIEALHASRPYPLSLCDTALLSARPLSKSLDTLHLQFTFPHPGLAQRVLQLLGRYPL